MNSDHDRHALRLLIVEDDPVVGVLLQEILEDAGYEIVGPCTTGEQAVALARKTQPSLVLMDIVLPGNLDGIDASKAIKDELDIPTIFISGHPPKRYLERAKSVVPLAFIPKPFTEEQIRVTVEIALYKRQIEAQDGENERNFRFLADNASDGILIAGEYDRHVFANEAAAKITGYSVSELTRMKFSDLLHPDEIPAIQDRYRKRILGKPLDSHYETRIIRKDGQTLTIEVGSAGTHWQNKPAAMALIRDISGRKRDEQQLQMHRVLLELELERRARLLEKVNKKLKQHLKRQIQARNEKAESERRWQNLIGTMNEGFLIADQNSVIRYVNPGLCKMTGYTESELVGKHWRDLFPKRFHHFLETKDKARHRGIQDSYETMWVTKDGGAVHVIHSASPMFDEKNHYQGVFLVITDISDLKKSQKSVEKREAQLHEANLTLKALLKKNKAEIARLEKQMAHNMHVLIAPLLKELKRSNRTPSQFTLVEHLERTLENFLSPYARTLSSELYNLSPTELKIATMVREGHSNKTIAQMLNLSPRTVELHRTRIRKKLKLTHKGTNLRTFLKNLKP